MSIFGAIFLALVIVLFIKESIHNSLHDSAVKNIAINHGEATMINRKHVRVDVVYGKPVRYGELANGDWVCVNYKNEIIENLRINRSIRNDTFFKNDAINRGWTAYRSDFKLPNMISAAGTYKAPDEVFRKPFYIDLSNGDRYIRREIDGTDWYMSLNTWTFVRPSDVQIDKWKQELDKNGFFYIAIDNPEAPFLKEPSPDKYPASWLYSSAVLCYEHERDDAIDRKVYSLEEALPLVTQRMQTVIGKIQKEQMKEYRTRYNQSFPCTPSTEYYRCFCVWDGYLEPPIDNPNSGGHTIITPKYAYKLMLTDEAHKYAGVPLLTQWYFCNPWCDNRGVETYRDYLKFN